MSVLHIRDKTNYNLIHTIEYSTNMVQEKKRNLFSWLSFKGKNTDKSHHKPSVEVIKKNTIQRQEALECNEKLDSLPCGQTCRQLDNSPCVESILPTMSKVDKLLVQSTQVAKLNLHNAVRPNVVAPAESSLNSVPIEISREVDIQVTMHEQEYQVTKSLFIRLKHSLQKTKKNLGSGFINLFRGKKIDENLFEQLEEQLLMADVGVDTTRKILDSLIQNSNCKQLQDIEELYCKIKGEMFKILAKVHQTWDVSGKMPYIILIVGVNGAGKTTTIGKLAHQFQDAGKSVMLAAGDTFRAAAVEQLQAWGKRNHILVVSQHTGADAASVIFDAVNAAKARNIDILIADTAGRLQNKTHLMEELKKIVRVMKKLDVQAPHEVMLILDASTGQNAISQVRLFDNTVGLTGITITKLDGTAKGGLIFTIADQFKIPIRYIGIGEDIKDLRPFKANDFIDALFAQEELD